MHTFINATMTNTLIQWITEKENMTAFIFYYGQYNYNFNVVRLGMRN